MLGDVLTILLIVTMADKIYNKERHHGPAYGKTLLLAIRLLEMETKKTIDDLDSL